MEMPDFKLGDVVQYEIGKKPGSNRRWEPFKHNGYSGIFEKTVVEFIDKKTLCVMCTRSDNGERQLWPLPGNYGYHDHQWGWPGFVGFYRKWDFKVGDLVVYCRSQYYTTNIGHIDEDSYPESKQAVIIEITDELITTISSDEVAKWHAPGSAEYNEQQWTRPRHMRFIKRPGFVQHYKGFEKGK